MDLAVGAKRRRVAMEQTTKEANPRLVPRCAYPLTAPASVRRVYPDLAVIDVPLAGSVLRQPTLGASLETVQDWIARRLYRARSG